MGKNMQKHTKTAGPKDDFARPHHEVSAASWSLSQLGPYLRCFLSGCVPQTNPRLPNRLSCQEFLKSIAVSAHDGSGALSLATEDLNPFALDNLCNCNGRAFYRTGMFSSFWQNDGWFMLIPLIPVNLIDCAMLHTESTKVCNSFHWTPWAVSLPWLVATDTASVHLGDVANPHLPVGILSSTPLRRPNTVWKNQNLLPPCMFIVHSCWRSYSTFSFLCVMWFNSFSTAFQVYFQATCLEFGSAELSATFRGLLPLPFPLPLKPNLSKRVKPLSAKLVPKSPANMMEII